MPAKSDQIVHVNKVFDVSNAMQMGFNSQFLMDTFSNLCPTDILLDISIPNRAGILTPIDGLEEGEVITRFEMEFMLSD